MNYNGKLFIAFSASILAGISIGYLLGDSDRNKIAKKLADKLITQKRKDFNEALGNLKTQLHDEAESLTNDVEKIATQML